MDPRFNPSVSSHPANHSLGSLSSLAAQQIPHQPSQTLPSLQHATMALGQSVYGQPSSAPHTPPISHGPSPSALAHLPSQSQYGHGGQSYQPTMMSHIGTSSSQLHPLAPAPAPTPGQGRLPVPLRPMPTGGLGPSMSLPSQYGQSQLLSQGAAVSQEPPRPTHVVGSQGRRGILPSAPGRAAAVSGATTAGKGAVIPAKDADGKFPCPHCTKTYLHAKHLKRHLLRHTGDRPYMCVLCEDRFSRSDILKRHFQKCSLRRGNPTGASHLSHSSAHLKKSHPGAHKPGEGADFLSSGIDGIGDGSFSQGHSIESSPTKYATDQLPNGLSRHNSYKGPGDGAQGARSITMPTPTDSNLSSWYGDQAAATTAAMNQSLTAFSMAQDPQQGHFGQPFGYNNHDTDSVLHQNGHQGMSHFDGFHSGQGNDLDWSTLFHPTGQDGHMNHMYSSNVGQNQIKNEPAVNNSSFQQPNQNHPETLFNGMYQHAMGMGSDGMLGSGSPHWNFDMSQTDPLQSKVDQLIAFCFPYGSDQPLPEQESTAELKRLLTVDNLKHFLDLFAGDFLWHWPLIHMPTFNILEAYDGLVLTIICIGAVYSDRVNTPQVRGLMEKTWSAVERTSNILATVKAESSNDTAIPIKVWGDSRSIEELQALVMLQTLFTWHGNPQQRAEARERWKNVVNVARKAGLLQPAPPGSPICSTLHQPNINPDIMSPSAFDWFSWVEQEKRSRVMFTVFLLDTAHVIYFNQKPCIDPFEVQLPLPADDAAWDARDSASCADALGLHGPGAQEAKNITGSRRKKQPEMHLALKALLHSSYELQPRSTNIQSKFVLVHALHIQIWNVQRQMAPLSSVPDFGNLPSIGSISNHSSGTTTPISQADWIANDGTTSSGHQTPVEGQSPGTHQLLKATTKALEKWKTAWDNDMQLQYPSSLTNLRRFGFCRDGVHFYWLARAFLRNNRAMDWQATPDTRFMQVMTLLKKVRSWVASDNAQRGEEIGSVGDIDEAYGVEELTLDMKLLFKPVNQRLDSPVGIIGMGNIGNPSIF